MSILNEIISDKKKEVELRKKLFPSTYWENPLYLVEKPIH